MTAPYKAGTIDLVSGSEAVSGTDTAWQVSLIIGGTIYVEFDGGNPLPIATVDSDTEITAALKWTGPTGTYSYAIVRDTAYGQQTVANAQALATYIQRLNNPALAATAGVSPASNKLLLFTGPNSATVIDLEDLLQGVRFDEEVPTLADRAIYDGEAEGFRVLVADIGDGRSAFYSKKSAASGDWSVPFYISGPIGDQGPYTDITIGDTTTLPAGSDAEVTFVPVSPGVIRLDFALPKGADGSGTGDVVGPAVATENSVSGFDGPTGKLIKALSAQHIRTAAKVQSSSLRNKLRNPLFSINQRGVSGTVTLAAGAYGHDRMRAGASGCTYTFSSSNGVTTLNITAGSLQQPIQASDFAGESATYFLSWAGTATGRINTGAYGASGVVSAVCDGSANVVVEFGTGTLSLVQFERDYVTDFLGARQNELALCQEFAWVTTAAGFVGLVQSGVGAAFCAKSTPVTMRSAPTLSVLGNPFWMRDGTTTVSFASIVDNTSSQNVLQFRPSTPTGSFGTANVPIVGYYTSGHGFILANSEIA